MSLTVYTTKQPSATVFSVIFFLVSLIVRCPLQKWKAPDDFAYYPGTRLPVAERILPLAATEVHICESPHNECGDFSDCMPSVDFTGLTDI